MKEVKPQLSRYSYCSKFSSDDQYLAMTTGSKVHIYKTADFSIYQNIKLKNPNFVHFVENSNLVCVNNTSGTMYIYDMLNSKFKKKLIATKNRKYIESDFVVDQNRKCLYLLTDNTLINYSIEDHSLKECIKFNGHFVKVIQHIPNNHQIVFLNSIDIDGENSQLIIYNYATMEKETLEFKDEALDYDLNVYMSEEGIFGIVLDKIVTLKVMNNSLIIDELVFCIQNGGIYEGIKDIKFSRKKDLIIIVASSKVYITNKRFEIIEELEIEYGDHAQLNVAENLLVLGSWKKNRIFNL